jgi:hypothetical protein
MIEPSEISRELDRLITLGHQDASLLTALHRKFPDLTESQLADGFATVKATRSMKTNLADKDL